MGPRVRPRRWLSSLIAVLIVHWLVVYPAIAGAEDSDPKGEPYHPGDVIADPGHDEESAESLQGGELRDPYGVVREGGHAEQVFSQVRYVLEGIVVTGNKRTKAYTVRKFIPLKQGDFLDPESPELVATEWRLMGTGWFDSVNLHLERGAERGYVVLVVDVKERNTIVIENLIAGMSEGLGDTTDTGRTLFPWFGFKLTETNLGGRGIQLSGTALGSEFQQGGRVDLQYPKLIKGEYALRFATYFLNGREFYGHSPLVSVPCGMPTCPGTSIVANAVVAAIMVLLAWRIVACSVFAAIVGLLGAGSEVVFDIAVNHQFPGGIKVLIVLFLINAVRGATFLRSQRRPQEPLPPGSTADGP